MCRILCKIGQERDRGRRSGMRGELSELRREVRRREEDAVKEVIKRSRVVLCTNAGAADYAFRHAQEEGFG